jgi:peptidoglycan hydrolase-like protein with peptidoglycan-binding domain
LVKKLLTIVVLTSLISGTALAATKATSTKKHKAASHKKVKKGSWKNRGQKQIADDRTREIQTALIRKGYLDGEPTGVMDAQTKSALTKLQADNGWQTKIVPDSRALIKLGLGPDQTNLINPDTAAMAAPATSGTTNGVSTGAGNPQR